MTENNTAPQRIEEVKNYITSLSPEAKREVVTEALKADPDSIEAKKAVVTEVARILPSQDRKNAAAATVRDLPDQDRKEVTAEAVRALPPEIKREVTAEAVQTLRPEDQDALAGLLRPSRNVADRVWLIIVSTFAVVFVLSAIAFFVAALWRAQNIELLLTVVTTVAGLLAGFISGRASSNDSGR